MMNRKGSALVASLAATALFAGACWAGADDKEKSPLHILMEKVNKANGALKKSVNTPVAFNKADKKEVAKKAEELAKLGKDAREMTDGVKKQKKSVDAWYKIMDEYVVASEDVAKALLKKDAKHDDVKKAFTAVQATCSNCHKEFRVDEDGGE